MGLAFKVSCSAGFELLFFFLAKQAIATFAKQNKQSLANLAVIDTVIVIDIGKEIEKENTKRKKAGEQRI